MGTPVNDGRDRTSRTNPLFAATENLAACSMELTKAWVDYSVSLGEANLELLKSSIRVVDQCARDIAGGSPESPDVALSAQLFPTPDHLRVDHFTPRSDTPGNVGVCLSGGGSRSMISSMGQLRALKALGLLGKVRAISSVSGGSWAAVPFTYLPDSIPEDNFLNGFVEDPSELTLTGGGRANKAAVLDYLPPGNLGNVAASPNMAVTSLAVQAWELLFMEQVPQGRLWTTLIGKNVLGAFGLSRFRTRQPAAGLFHVRP